MILFIGLVHNNGKARLGGEPYTFLPVVSLYSTDLQVAVIPATPNCFGSLVIMD